MRKLGIVVCSLFLAGALWGCSDDDGSGDPVCGDGIVGGTEECDDGNAVDDDVCSNDCLINPVCGDGNTDPGEECDDGNTVDDDGCSNDCQISAICGDDAINGGDLCDGSDLGVATCESEGFAGGVLACAADCQSYDTSGCDDVPDNDSCQTATLITMDSITPEVIETAGDHDFFEFQGLAGDWINISTDANPDDNPDMVDTVITLLDENCVQIAENDDSVPRVNTDSQLLTRLPADGTYYVQVQEFSDWYGDTPIGDPTFTYELSVNILPSNSNLLLDPETGDDAASAAALPSNPDNYWILYGMFRDDADIDVYSFTIAADPPTSGGINLDFMPDGTDGYGSTTPTGLVYITDVGEATIFAQVDPSAGYEDLTLPTVAGDYLLWVEHPGTAAGTNDFYFIKTFIGGTNPVETDSVANEVAAGAQALDVQPNGTINSGFILAWIDAGDTDHYSFLADAGDTVTIACGSSSMGSGLQQLAVDLLDSTEAVMSTQTEQPGPDGILIEDVAITSSGMHYLRMSAAGQDAVIVGNYVYCGVHITPAP